MHAYLSGGLEARTKARLSIGRQLTPLWNRYSPPLEWGGRLEQAEEAGKTMFPSVARGCTTLAASDWPAADERSKIELTPASTQILRLAVLQRYDLFDMTAAGSSTHPYTLSTQRS